MPTYGRIFVPEPASTPRHIHSRSAAGPLKVVDWEPPVSVLDQEDLHNQGINCSTFIPGAGNPTELGSCVPNTTVEHLSGILDKAGFTWIIETLTGKTVANAYTDTVTAEMAAIVLYYHISREDSNPKHQWPPNDWGTTGLNAYNLCGQYQYVAGEKVAEGATNIVSLMQTGPVMIGLNWFNKWEEPSGPSYFLDGSGSDADYAKDVASKVAGGHEITGSAVEKLTMLPTGEVDPYSTVIRIRNHWDPTWADHGSARIHLSSIIAAKTQVDVRQMYAAA